MYPIILLTKVKLPASFSKNSRAGTTERLTEQIKSGKIGPIILEPETLLVLDGVRRVTLAINIGIKYLPYVYGRLYPSPGWGHRIEILGAHANAPFFKRRYNTRTA